MPQFQDIYEICVNKSMLTRPSAQDLLGLDLIQNWAKDMNIMNQ